MKGKTAVQPKPRTPGPWELTVSEVDRLFKIVSALTAFVDLLGESDNDTCALISPHVEALESIHEQLTERFRARQKAGAE